MSANPKKPLGNLQIPLWLFTLFLCCTLFLNCFLQPPIYPPDVAKKKKFFSRSSHKKRRISLADYPALRYEEIIFSLAKKNGVNPYILMALIEVESSGRAYVVSRKKAYGLMQILLSTARQYKPDVTGEDLLNPDINLNIGVQHLIYIIERLNNRFPYFPYLEEEEMLKLIAAAWNAGCGSVLREKGIPNNGETPTMVSRFMTAYKKYQQLYENY